MRYEIYPIEDENMNSLCLDTIVAETNDPALAKLLAETNSYFPFGAGILDTETGKIDVGFGFGVPCPKAN